MCTTQGEGSAIPLLLLFVIDYIPRLGSCVWDKFQSSGAIVDLADCDGERTKYITWDRGQHHVPSLFSFLFLVLICYMQIYTRIIYTKYIYYITNMPPGTEVNTMCLPFLKCFSFLIFVTKLLQIMQVVQRYKLIKNSKQCKLCKDLC